MKAPRAAIGVAGVSGFLGYLVLAGAEASTVGIVAGVIFAVALAWAASSVLAQLDRTQ